VVVPPAVQRRTLRRDVLVQRELESQSLSVSGLKGYDLRVPLLCDRFFG
jgi:hypothetical protein